MTKQVPIFRLKNVSHWYEGLFKEKKKILNHLNLELHGGETLVIQGVSGSGKSTLLNILGGFIRPKRGQVYYNVWPIKWLPDVFVSHLRSQRIGFIFQDYHLLPNYSVYENILFSLYFSYRWHWSSRRRIYRMARRLGIDHLLHKKPFRLSGGERQRVAILRALAIHPKLILADEPTGNLDDDNSEQVKRALLHFQRQMGYALLVVTHDSSLMSLGQKRFLLRAGSLRLLETTS